MQCGVCVSLGHLSIIDGCIWPEADEMLEQKDNTEDCISSYQIDLFRELRNLHSCISTNLFVWARIILAISIFLNKLYGTFRNNIQRFSKTRPISSFSTYHTRIIEHFSKYEMFESVLTKHKLYEYSWVPFTWSIFSISLKIYPISHPHQVIQKSQIYAVPCSLLCTMKALYYTMLYDYEIHL